MLCLAVVASSLTAQSSEAAPQQPPRWLTKKSNYLPEVKAFTQLWGIYSMGMEVYDASSGKYEAADDRFNLSLRRARVVIAGEPYAGLKYSVALGYDQTGRDILSSGVGGTNKADPSLSVVDAFLQWKIGKGEAFNLVGGWFRPQVQRESITGAWATNSFEKSMSQNYLRSHLVGTGYGRAAGLNLGGIFTKEKVSLNYNLGMFNPVTASLAGGSVGKKAAPLFAGRASLSLGDPEFNKYGIGYNINFFNKRKGVSLDFNAARQGETEKFQSSTAYGPGLLLNWGALNLDGEWMWLKREGTDSLGSFNASSATGHIRLGMNFSAGKYVLEPTFMLMKFKGGMSATEQADAALLKLSAGEETTYDLGVNWYLDGRNLKLALHYTWRNGDPGVAGDGSQVNAYFSQGGVGAIHRGNWLGLGLSAMF
ncbi:MAG: OprO/OprP family phosphate-selective porin [Saprospiraceae bacterium]|nr:OprO/OprP family phosphate-selective porin [Saprospiraceae bacterium]MCF8251777.1 OprO/OprP family phosphate-selective porin [Saprospiraceae bacterium]MCF8281263.1 OprO/OprP family phosphate-selective porin [Bacteroidales bacterium]MCF8313419.1 OprO/OprP family phosphate-selective porin [Saprospiraceae bacterium]MCF8442132.1 OprO/OprP family phosphate-selective porin [Saprospiraceae bacterium]